MATSCAGHHSNRDASHSLGLLPSSCAGRTLGMLVGPYLCSVVNRFLTLMDAQKRAALSVSYE